jgi:hypothetical protein
VSTDSRDFSDLRHRIVNLEAQNRRFKRIGAAALIGVTLLLVMGQAPLKRRVEANEFVLADGNGNVRAKLSMNLSIGGAGTPQMVFLDSEGRKNLEVNGAVGAFGGSVGIFNEQGGRVGTFVAADTGGHLWVSNREGGASRIDVGPTSVDISDDDGTGATLGTKDFVTPKTGETHKTSAASLILFDNNNNPIWRAP